MNLHLLNSRRFMSRSVAVTDVVVRFCCVVFYAVLQNVAKDVFRFVVGIDCRHWHWRSLHKVITLSSLLFQRELYIDRLAVQLGRISTLQVLSWEFCWATQAVTLESLKEEIDFINAPRFVGLPNEVIALFDRHGHADHARQNKAVILFSEFSFPACMHAATTRYTSTAKIACLACYMLYGLLAARLRYAWSRQLDASHVTGWKTLNKSRGDDFPSFCLLHSLLMTEHRNFPLTPEPLVFLSHKTIDLLNSGPVKPLPLVPSQQPKQMRNVPEPRLSLVPGVPLWGQSRLATGWCSNLSVSVSALFLEDSDERLERKKRVKLERNLEVSLRCQGPWRPCCWLRNSDYYLIIIIRSEC